MSSSRYDKVEAVLSAMEDERLRLMEARATVAQLDQQEEDWKQQLADHDDPKLFYLVRRAFIPQRCWLMEATNAYAHNVLFYEGRLEAFLES